MNSLTLQIEDIARLRDYNMKLQAEIQVMTREVDMFNSGQGKMIILICSTFFEKINGNYVNLIDTDFLQSVLSKGSSLSL